MTGAASTIDDVLTFWFAETEPKQWFVGNPAFDQACRARLAPLVAEAAAGALDHWRDSAAGCVALCILLDQMPRNLHRGEARAFATDSQALAVTRHALDQGFDRAVPEVQGLFLYMPLQHSESLDDQELCVRLTSELGADPKWHDYAVRHRDIIARFGRFPHRNAALGRASTPEEIAFLKEPGSSF